MPSLCFDPNMVEQGHLPGIDSYLETLTKAATGTYQYPPPERWAKNLAATLGHDLTLDQANTFASDLSASYEYRKSLFEMVNGNRNYNPDKRKGDWVDGQQLMYLADPSMHMLTDESAIRQRCERSPQSERIFLLPEFVRDWLGIDLPV